MVLHWANVGLLHVLWDQNFNVTNAVKCKSFVAIKLESIEGRRHRAMEELHKIYDGDTVPFGHMSMGRRMVSTCNIDN